MFILKALVQLGLAQQEITRASRYQSQLSLFSHEWFSKMIIKDLKISSQNVCKNHLLTETILENNKNFNILFIQELL